MRIWSVHPRYLDRQGLGGLWRECLGAQQNLLADIEGRKIGYDGHPQLIRFRAHQRPLDALATYLKVVWQEAHERGYSYDWDKVKGQVFDPSPGTYLNQHIPVTTKQLGYEKRWLYYKLVHREIRTPYKEMLRADSLINSELVWHPLFAVHYGDIEPWEKPVDIDALKMKEVVHHG